MYKDWIFDMVVIKKLSSFISHRVQRSNFSGLPICVTIG
jgi:hypothetical protein